MAPSLLSYPLSTILQPSSPSLKVGRYNGPHLTSIYDCITIDNTPVSPVSYGAAHAEVSEKDLEKGTKLSVEKTAGRY